MSAIHRFIRELQRRQVFGVVVIYAVAAWGFVEVADNDTVQDMFGVDSQLVLLAAIIGFPFAVVAGWFYDITKQGVFRTPPATAEDTFERTLGPRDFAILAVFGLLWIVSVYLAYVPSPVDRSIAVMPFENRSNDPDNQILGFGIRDDLNVHLGELSALKVIESSSVDQVDASLPPHRIGERLGVAYLLKSSVERIADRIRVNVMLIETADARVAWAGSFDRTLTTEGLFAIRSGIASAIATGLRMKLTESEQQRLDGHPTDNVEAYQAYIRGKYALTKRGRDSLDRAIEELTEAVTLDPDYAVAHADLALAMMIRDYSDREVAIPNAERALLLDPDLAEAHAAMGYFTLGQGSDELQAGLEHFRTAIAIRPNYGEVHNWMATLYGLLGLHEERFSSLQASVRLDPLSTPGNFNYVVQLLVRERFAEADKHLEHFASFAPPFMLRQLKGVRASLEGNWAEMIFALLDIMQTSNAGTLYDIHSYLLSIGLADEAQLIQDPDAPNDAQYLLSIGRPEEALELARSQQQSSHTAVHKAHELGLALAWTGEYDKAQPHLEELLRLIGGSGPKNLDEYIIVPMDALVVIRREAGDLQGSEELLAQLARNVRRARDAGLTLTRWGESVDYWDGRVSYLRGDRDRGFAQILKAVSAGYWLRPPSAFQQPMFDEPGFARILEVQKRTQDRERRKVLDVVCHDNPYADVWQPMDETCSEF